MPRGTFPDCCCQCLHPCGEPLQTQSSIGDPPTLAGSFSSVSCGVTFPFPWVLVHARFCLCPPRLESLFPPVLWKFYNQIPLAFKVRFPGDSQPCCQNPRLEAWCGVQNLHNSGTTYLVLLFSSLWVTHMAGMEFVFIVIVSLLPPCCGLFFDFVLGLCFFSGFQCPPIDGCSTPSCDFGALTGADERTSF